VESRGSLKALSVESRPVAVAAWGTDLAVNEWDVYHSAIEVLRGAGVRFMLGGAFGLAAFTNRCRNTKDIDFFLLPRDRERGVQALTAAGFEDYYSILPYDRGWIYRSIRSGMIVDLIWGTPNRRTQVDELWLEHAGKLSLRGEILEVIPAEELLWIKLYVLQRDRCDWPDLINLLYYTCSTLDWSRLVARLEDDLPLLLGLLSVFAWVCPGRARHIPSLLRQRAGVKLGRGRAVDFDPQRIQLLDSRPWFGPMQPAPVPEATA